MDRRSFIRNSAMAGGAAAVLPSLSACNNHTEGIVDAASLTYLPDTVPGASVLQEGAG